MAAAKKPTVKKAPGATQPVVKPPAAGVVGARSGNYGKANSRTQIATANKRGSKLRGGQSPRNPYGGYSIKLP